MDQTTPTPPPSPPPPQQPPPPLLLDDQQIQQKIEQVLSSSSKKLIKILSCEKKSSSETEERLLINGFPVQLEGEEGARIREALKAGLAPPCELLNDILLRCGVLKNPVELETIVNVKSRTKTTEVVSIRGDERDGGLLWDERVKEVEEEDEVRSGSKEVWKTEKKDKGVVS